MRQQRCYFKRTGLIRIKPGMDPDRTIFIFGNHCAACQRRNVCPDPIA